MFIYWKLYELCVCISLFPAKNGNTAGKNGTRSSHSELSDEELQVTDSTPPASQRGNRSLHCALSADSGHARYENHITVAHRMMEKRKIIL